jgi:hypothetical protein
MTKGIIYYSDCRGDQALLEAARAQLSRAAGKAMPIVSCTLRPLAFGFNVCLDMERGHLTMFRQILTALEMSTADVIFHCEHDVLYHPSHFNFEPSARDRFYYNQHTWRVDRETGRALFYYCNQVSGLCADRQLLIDHYRRLVRHVVAHGFDRALGYEPGTNRRQREFGASAPVETWMSPQPNVDIKTEFCLTKGRWSQEQFRNKSTCQGWTESDRVPGWGVTLGRMDSFLADVTSAQQEVA